MLGSLCSSCRTAARPKREAAWMIGLSLVLVAITLALQLIFGETAYTQALLYAAFPMALVATDAATGRRGSCSSAVRGAGFLLAIVAMYAFFLGVVLLADTL